MAFTFDSNNNLNVNTAEGGGGNPAAGATGAAVPADADYTGYNSGGNLVGVSTANPLPVAQQGNVTVVGTGTLAVQATLPAGQAVELLDSGGTNKASIDATGDLQVDVNNFPASQTVAGTVTANQGTANTAANAWPVEVTDGTNVNSVKAASTAAVSTDKSIVVQLNPVQPNLTSALNVSLGSAIVEVSPTTAANTNANPFFTSITDGTTKAAVIAGTTALKTDLSSVAGTATVTSASGVQRVGIAGNGNVALDGTAAAGTSPTTSASSSRTATSTTRPISSGRRTRSA